MTDTSGYGEYADGYAGPAAGVTIIGASNQVSHNHGPNNVLSGTAPKTVDEALVNADGGLQFIGALWKGTDDAQKATAAALGTETTRATDAEAALDAHVTDLVSTEAATARATEAALGATIADETTRAQAAEAALDARITAMTPGDPSQPDDDTAILQQISDLAAALATESATRKTNDDAEVWARAVADSGLDARIKTLEAIKAATRITALEQANTALTARVTKLEQAVATLTAETQQQKLWDSASQTFKVPPTRGQHLIVPMNDPVANAAVPATLPPQNSVTKLLP